MLGGGELDVFIQRGRVLFKQSAIGCLPLSQHFVFNIGQAGGTLSRSTGVGGDGVLTRSGTIWEAQVEIGFSNVIHVVHEAVRHGEHCLRDAFDSSARGYVLGKRSESVNWISRPRRQSCFYAGALTT